MDKIDTTPAPTAKPDKPEPSAPVKPEPTAATPKSDIPNFSKIGEFRKWAESRHETAKRLEGELSQLQTKLSQLEQVVPKTQQESGLLTTKITTLEKQIGQYEQLLATHVYEQSPQYKKDFQQPYFDALTRANRKMTEFTVRMATGEKDADDNEVFKDREATAGDFQYIYNLPARQARAEARKLFGTDAEEVLRMRDTVGELAEKAIAAVNEHKESWQEQMKQSEASRMAQRNQSDQFWRKANEAISADPKFQKFWGEEKDDLEANKALTEGFNLADYFFSEERDKLPPQDRIAFDANVRHRIAGFGKMRYLVTKLSADLDARNAEIAQLRGSSPGKPTPTSPVTTETRKGYAEAIDALPD